MPYNDGYEGPRDGPFRGERLQRCVMHDGWWRKSRPCPACVLQARVVVLEAEIERLRAAQKETP